MSATIAGFDRAVLTSAARTCEPARAVHEQVRRIRESRAVQPARLRELSDELAAAQTKAANLEIALHTARQIGIAIGILMARMQLSEDQAFDALRTASQHRQVKLREVAARVVLTGALTD